VTSRTRDIEWYSTQKARAKRSSIQTLDYRSSSPQSIRRPAELASAIVGVAVFTVPAIVGVALFLCWDADWDADWGVRSLFLLFVTAMSFGVWRFTSQIWKLCRRNP
jgi:hypothetical protein